MTIEIVYEIIDHGIIHPSYFQGQGTAYTGFEFVVTGIGDTYNEAIFDALELIAEEHNVNLDQELSEIEIKEIVSEATNELSSAASYQRIEISNQITPADYTDCPLEPGTFCEHCHALVLADLLDNTDELPFYHVSILYNLEDKDNDCE